MLFLPKTLGTPIIALFGIESENGVTSVTISMVNIINSEGVKLLSLNNLTKVDSGSYVCVFLPPSETFQMQLVGSDGNGYNYSHIIDTAVEVADISLVLGMFYYRHVKLVIIIYLMCDKSLPVVCML